VRLGRVIGTLVPATLVEGMTGVPLLWVQPLDKLGREAGQPFVAADGTRMAGPGETIYWEASREAALTLDPSFVPVDHAVVGLVDDVQIDGQETAREPAATPGAGSAGGAGAPGAPGRARPGARRRRQGGQA
jgi:ethanolamine utilization protein EutN